MTDDKQELSAFPNGNLFPGNRGLTMRDWFAANAPEVPEWFEWERNSISPFMPSETTIQRMVRWKYEYADAMMAQREK